MEVASKHISRLEAEENASEYGATAPQSEDEKARLTQARAAFEKEFGETKSFLDSYTLTSPSEKGGTTKADRLSGLAYGNNQDAKVEIEALQVDTALLINGDSKDIANYLHDLKLSDPKKFRRLVQIQSDYEAFDKMKNRISKEVRSGKSDQQLLQELRENRKELPEQLRNWFRDLAGRKQLQQPEPQSCGPNGCR